MKTTLATAAAALLALLAGTALAAQQAAVSEPVPNANAQTSNAGPQPASDSAGFSKVRIVRLSQARGAVQLDRNTGQGFESGFPNLPITEGARLQTRSGGFAEVEFEDNSTVRLAPNSLVEFPRLELLPSGAKVSTVNVLRGTVYVSRASTKGNQFMLTFGQQKVFPLPSSHLRLQMEAPSAELAVLDGSIQVQETSGLTEVGKKKTLTFPLASQSEPIVTKDVAENQNDAWDRSSFEYHKQYANSSAFGNMPYAYGISDLNYYGSFMNFGACGSMWQPYFVNATWDPFSNGLWAWYPGAGYSWVSPYPWGWTPFHYGAWNYCPGFGWGWLPGGSWVGLNNSLLQATQSGKPFVPIHPPGHRPLPGGSTLLPVNLKPLSVSGLGAHNTFVFRNNSAGLGIPRGDLGAMRGLSNGVERSGSFARTVHVEPLQTGRFGSGEANRRRGGYGSEGEAAGRNYSDMRRADGGDSASGRPAAGDASADKGRLSGGDTSGDRGGFSGRGMSGDAGGMSRGGGAPSGGPPPGPAGPPAGAGGAPAAGVGRGH